MNEDMEDKTLSGDEFRICLKCHVPHYENCKHCFGFGLYPEALDNGMPVPLGAGLSETVGDAFKPCPNGCTPAGIPRNVILVSEAVYNQIVELIKNPPEPTQALIDLMKDVPTPQDVIDEAAAITALAQRKVRRHA